MTTLPCGFCLKPLPIPREMGALAALTGQVHQCRHCGAAYLLVSDRTDPRGTIASALHLPGAALALTASPCLAEVEARPLFLVCGWDPGELLSTVRVARILELHRATVQQHVREGRFPGARQVRSSAGGSRGYWGIPRHALQAYLRNKGKAGDGAAAGSGLRRPL